MTNERIIQIDSVDAYNKLYGWETSHPLVMVVKHANSMASDLNHSRLNYGLYALFLLAQIALIYFICNFSLRSDV